MSLTVTDHVIHAGQASAVPFTIAGLEPEDTGKVTFGDGTHHVTVNVSSAATHYTADLSTLSDGPIASTLSGDTDPAGNSFTPVDGNTVVLDQEHDEDKDGTSLVAGDEFTQHLQLGDGNHDRIVAGNGAHDSLRVGDGNHDLLQAGDGSHDDLQAGDGNH